MREEGEARKRRKLSDADWLVRVGRALIKDGVWNDAFSKLARHEATQLNALRRTLNLLEEMRASRKYETVTIDAVALSVLLKEALQDEQGKARENT